nr:hypothetical protein B0A51_11767 [Rachicladosporium sp. CCFEE 5018]
MAPSAEAPNGTGISSSAQVKHERISPPPVEHPRGTKRPAAALEESGQEAGSDSGHVKVEELPASSEGRPEDLATIRDQLSRTEAELGTFTVQRTRLDSEKARLTEDLTHIERRIQRSDGFIKDITAKCNELRTKVQTLEEAQQRRQRFRKLGDSLDDAGIARMLGCA